MGNTAWKAYKYVKQRRGTTEMVQCVGGQPRDHGSYAPPQPLQPGPRLSAGSLSTDVYSKGGYGSVLEHLISYFHL